MTFEWSDGSVTLYCGDALAVLRSLPSESVQCCVTSPPYWGLRSYGVEGQLGLEKTPEEYVAVMVAIFREVRRVLRPDGVLWLNLGDSYCGSWGNSGQRPELDGASDGQRNKATEYLPRGGWDGRREVPPNQKIAGLKPKDLCGIPWRVAFALQADGWYLRSDIIWAKPNPMPESVTDRPTKAHEYIFLLTKSARYFYDAEAVKEAVALSTVTRVALAESRPEVEAEIKADLTDGYKRCPTARVTQDRYADGRDHLVCAPKGNGRNLRSVWTFPTQAFSGAHFATFPVELPLRCIKAGTSEKGCCPTCGKAWERVVERTPTPKGLKNGEHREIGRDGGLTERTDDVDISQTGRAGPVTSLGFRPGCSCGGEPVPCTILDCFAGASTTGVAALQLDRKFIGIELNPEYVKMSRERLQKTVAPLTYVSDRAAKGGGLFEEEKA